ncbi:MerR family transcriptional regulator [Brevibacterium spongiae]|uniref:MerR family transcriptional regulator n=1 Tax=Brevibacterium spongiae TaxID=2909672 RepID=A0ABY5SN83_9MICO|nr:MerR family transcriptional regulator [Brevibacterium spongiae]UVI36030.1 MerR family transcriptional regulator [Brevibacterium spongiae]
MESTREPEATGTADVTGGQQSTSRSLQTIGDFARAVGLSASALREYGSSGLLRPAHVEDRTGYRYYGLDQQQRAIWIRRLRDAGFRLRTIGTILDSEPATAGALLDDWLAEAVGRADSAAALVDDLKAVLRSRSETPRVSRARVDSAVLAAAVRQLARPKDTDTADPPLDDLCVEIRTDALTLAVTDGFMLMARMRIPAQVDAPSAADGAPGPVGASTVVTASALISPLIQSTEVAFTIAVTGGSVDRPEQVHVSLEDSDGESTTLTQPDRGFPDIGRTVEAAVARRRGRSRFRRNEILRLVDETAGRSPGTGVFLPGESERFELSVASLTAIAEAAVGDELICDWGGDADPLVWRAPSQPDFVALVMPRRV